MSLWNKITRSNFVIRLKAWEYWPFGVIHFPVIIYYFWLSLRARSLIFFSASNPGIEMGGMFGESKFDILRKIPPTLVPVTELVEIPTTKQRVIEIMDRSNLKFPVIFKPDLGERGFMVQRINSEREVDAYLKNIKVRFLIQELVELPDEFGIFYTRFPNEPSGRVTSVVAKEMLSIVGDGRRTIRELIHLKDRAKLQWKSLRHVYASRLDEVLPAGKTLQLVSIGNHAKGTKFLDGSHLINHQLTSLFDGISKRIPGFYFGRFDIRARSIAEVYAGKFKVLELNGCGAEPAHIYDPDFPATKAIAVLFKHWKNIFEIARQNEKAGVRVTSVLQAYHSYKKFKAATS
jgi:hypothetical protein